MQNNSPNIIIIEDDKQIRNFICYALDQEGFRHFDASDAQTGLSILASESIDLVLLDLGLPDLDGMEVISRVRQWSDIPIIVVSARDQDNEKVAALDSGADDYITKPFSATELMARIRVSLRHSIKNNQGQSASIITNGELIIDLDKHIVYLNKAELHVTPLEYSLISILMKNVGKVLTTQYIIKEVYGISYGSDTQALRSLMASLRRKIEITPAKPKYIITEIGVGYRLIEQ